MRLEVFDNCREFSTNQLLFMQNKPNFRKSQMNANLYNTTDYENKWQRRVRKNKPNTNPNKPNFQKAKMNINLTLTKGYRKKDDFLVRINKANSNPISKKPKMNVNLYVIKEYENKTALRPKKTNPIQTQFPKGQNELKIACQKIWPHPIATGKIERGCALLRVMVLWTLSAQCRILLPHWREPGQSD